jgi:hypothetical protein
MQVVLRVKFSDLNRFWVSFRVVNLEANAGRQCSVDTFFLFPNRSSGPIAIARVVVG